MNLKPIHLGAAALLLMASAFAATAAAGDKGKTPLEGSWKGKDGDDKFTFTVTGAKWVLKGNHNGEEQFFSGNLKTDPKQSPKTIDLEVVDGSEMAQKWKGKTALGIFEIDGDSLKWCANEPGREARPKDFSKDGDGGQHHLNLVFQREKK